MELAYLSSRLVPMLVSRQTGDKGDKFNQASFEVNLYSLNQKDETKYSFICNYTRSFGMDDSS